MGSIGSGMPPIDVLLVEDNPGDAFLISLIVSEAPVQINLSVAQDGVQALFKLAERHPALVILDLNLPAVSGHAILRHYHPPDVPIVVFSSSGSEEERQRSLAEGAREFVQKPSGFDDYKRAVLGMIEKWILPKDAHDG
jgi:CheY-like chemotaxis protein